MSDYRSITGGDQTAAYRAALAAVKAEIGTRPDLAYPKLIALTQTLRRSEDKSLALEATRNSVYCLISLARLDEAHEANLGFIKFARETGSMRHVALATMYSGAIANESGAFAAAVEFFEAALAQAKELNDRDLAARVRINLGVALEHMHRYDEAKNLYLSALLDLETEFGHAGVSGIFFNITSSLVNKAASIDRSTPQGEAIVMQLLEEFFEVALAAYETKPDQMNYCLIECSYALAEALGGNHQGAAIRLADIWEVIDEMGSDYLALNWSEAWSRVAEVAGDKVEMLAAVLQTIDLAEKTQSLGIIQRHYQKAAELFAEAGDMENAYRYLSKAIKRLEAAQAEQGIRNSQILQAKLEIDRILTEQSKLREHNLRLEEQNRILEEAAHQDPLTGVLNRRGLNTELIRLQSEPLQPGFERWVGLLDIDHFKSVNDRFGHGVGDEVIQEFASILSAPAHGFLTVGRMGGEEFLFVMDVSGSGEIATRVNCLLGEFRFRNWSNIAPGLRITASIGLSQLDKAISIHESINRADQHLYHAKNTGRDKWCVDSAPRAA